MMAFSLALALFSGLFDNALATRLQRNFDNAGVSYLVWRIDEQAVVAQNWMNMARAPMGSLAKPFVALKLDAARTADCSGAQCWQRAGHGRLDLINALAQSCNSYFLQAAQESDPTRIISAALEHGLPQPESQDAPSLIGIGRGWLATALELAAAYGSLARSPGANAVLHGMRLAAQRGTAALSRGAGLMKTGTSACDHQPRAPGDGMVAALYPADAPEYVLILRIHGTTGAQAARTAGAMLRAIDEIR